MNKIFELQFLLLVVTIFYGVLVILLKREIYKVKKELYELEEEVQGQ